jgi:SsrA-binding protein
MKKSNDLVSNRRARHDYEILETFEAGIMLQGTEVKSLRDNLGSLQEAYIKILSSELWLIGCHIPPYSHGNIHNHEERRDRKLLMHKREIQRLKEQTQEKGLTLVPLGIYLTKKGKIKVCFGLGRGKKLYDKRQDLKAKDEKRRMQRALRGED